MRNRTEPGIDDPLVAGSSVGVDNHARVVMDGCSRPLAVLGPGITEDGEPGIGRRQPPRGPHRHRFTGSLGLISQVPVPDLRVITMGIEENIGPVRLGDVGFWDWRCQQPVVGLAGELGMNPEWWTR